MKSKNIVEEHHNLKDVRKLMDDIAKEHKLELIYLKLEGDGKVPSGCVVKRLATKDESLHVLREILGLNIDLVLDECYDDAERQDYLIEMTDAFNTFLMGGDFGKLCRTCRCEQEDPESWMIGQILMLVSYCQKKGIL